MPKKYKRKNKRRVKKNFQIDPAIVNFLLEHLRIPKVDFSKIKFPSYIKYLNNIK